MPWDGSGQFNRIYGANGWVNDAATAVNILASRHDTHDQDLAGGIQNAITKDGQSKAAAHLIPSLASTYDLGSVAVPWRAVNAGAVTATTVTATTLVGTISSNVQSAAEITAGVTPVNYVYPPLCVDRYGTNTTPGTTDMTTAWQAAIAVASVTGGVVTCLQTTYRTSTTLLISGPASIDGGNSFASHTLAPGISAAQIYCTANVPVLQYTVGSRFVRLDNINIVGSSAGAAQDGVQIGYNVAAGAHGIYMRNVAIFNCGNYGLKVINSVGGKYDSLYIQSCADGIVLVNDGAGGTIGANRWYNVNVTSCTSVDIDFNNTAGGYDTWYGVTAETSNYGIVFESGVVGQKMHGVHTEGNAIQSVWFKSGSNKNIVDFETVGSSEPLPLNQGGAQNVWTGNWVVSGVFKDPIRPKCIQRVSTLASTVVSGSGLSAYSAASAPTTSGGLLVLTQAVTQHNTGSKLVARAWGVSRIGTTGTMIVALFQSGSTTAVEAIQMPAVGGTFYSWSLEHEFTAGTQNNVTTFTVRVGSTTGPDTADAFGQFGGAITSGGISVEEYLPSTG